jgi:hypothetical protein
MHPVQCSFLDPFLQEETLEGGSSQIFLVTRFFILILFSQFYRFIIYTVSRKYCILYVKLFAGLLRLNNCLHDTSIAYYNWQMTLQPKSISCFLTIVLTQPFTLCLSDQSCSFIILSTWPIILLQFRPLSLPTPLS